MTPFDMATEMERAWDDCLRHLRDEGADPDAVLAEAADGLDRMRELPVSPEPPDGDL